MAFQVDRILGPRALGDVRGPSEREHYAQLDRVDPSIEIVRESGDAVEVGVVQLVLDT